MSLDGEPEKTQITNKDVRRNLLEFRIRRVVQRLHQHCGQSCGYERRKGLLQQWI